MKKQVRLKSTDPRAFLLNFPGLGVARANALYDLGVRQVDDLKKPEIYSTLPFETQLNIKYPVDRKIPWTDADKFAHMLPPGVMMLGSYRRHKPFVGDFDLLTTRPLIEVMLEIKNIPGFNIEGEFISGDKRHAFIGKYENRYFHVDLFHCTEEELPTAMMHWTGSMMWNVIQRAQAIRKGYTLNQYGLFDRKGNRIPVRSERDVFDKLGMKWKEPEERNK